MKLIGTARSHFTRKVRILLDAYQRDYEFIDVGNVADVKAFGENPLMKVPTFVHGETWMIESDHIAAFITRGFQPDDPYQVLRIDHETLNLRAIMNGIMALEVEILLAERTGLPTNHARFQKMRDSMLLGLTWLEKNHHIIPEIPSYAGFHLVCMWDHLYLYETVKLNYPRLTKRVKSLSQLDFVALSRPE